MGGEPCPRFKEWTNDRRSVDFTFAVTVPPVIHNTVFGPFNFERDLSILIHMIHCLTADLQSDKYFVTFQPGEKYRIAQDWWFLVTASHTHTLFRPHSSSDGG